MKRITLKYHFNENKISDIEIVTSSAINMKDSTSVGEDQNITAENKEELFTKFFEILDKNTISDVRKLDKKTNKEKINVRQSTRENKKARFEEITSWLESNLNWSSGKPNINANVIGDSAFKKIQYIHENLLSEYSNYFKVLKVWAKTPYDIRLGTSYKGRIFDINITGSGIYVKNLPGFIDASPHEQRERSPEEYCALVKGFIEKNEL